jgi:LSD1 subclass zinc finger protein
MNADLAIRAPRVLPPGARAISCALNGAVELVRDMITKGEASVYDVDHGGASLLFASLILT